jgi:glycerol-3-phosphate acyltransferase PlsY
MVSRYVSLASISAACILPFISYFLFDQQSLAFVWFNAIISVLVIVAHHKNIKRLIAGEEQRMNFNASKM